MSAQFTIAFTGLFLLGATGIGCMVTAFFGASEAQDEATMRELIREDAAS